MVYCNCFSEQKIYFSFQSFWSFAPLEGISSMILLPFNLCQLAMPTKMLFKASLEVPGKKLREMP
jgi:hypothetical protein